MTFVITMGEGGRGYSEFIVTGMIEWGQKSKPPNSPDQILAPQKSYAKFPSPKNFQKALNNITQKLETIMVMGRFVHLFITPSGERTFSASGGHGNNT